MLLKIIKMMIEKFFKLAKFIPLILTICILIKLQTVGVSIKEIFYYMLLVCAYMTGYMHEISEEIKVIKKCQMIIMNKKLKEGKKEWNLKN